MNDRRRMHMALALLLAQLSAAACHHPAETGKDAVTFLLAQALTARDAGTGGGSNSDLAGPACGMLASAEKDGDLTLTLATANSVLIVAGPAPLAGCRPTAFSGTIGSGTLTYNARGRLSSMVMDGLSTSFTYNEKGFITSRSSECANTSAGNYTMSVSYDAQGRALESTVVTPANCSAVGNPASGESITMSYSYSGSGGTTTSSFGTITSVSTYDEQGRPASVAMSCAGSCSGLGGNGASATITYAYGTNGELHTMACSGGAVNMCITDFTATLGYDTAGRLVSVTGGNGSTFMPTSASFTYNTLGQVTQAVQTFGGTTYTMDFTN